MGSGDQHHPSHRRAHRRPPLRCARASAARSPRRVAAAMETPDKTRAAKAGSPFRHAFGVRVSVGGVAADGSRFASFGPLRWGWMTCSSHRPAHRPFSGFVVTAVAARSPMTARRCREGGRPGLLTAVHVSGRVLAGRRCGAESEWPMQPLQAGRGCSRAQHSTNRNPATS